MTFQSLICSTLLALASTGHGEAGGFPQDPTGWPAATPVNKPWTRWWWPGSAVDKENLTRQLEDFARAGIGGVEICPIYGATGAEDRFLKFLSPEWMAMLAHTTTEAKRLGLQVDMTTGTGWPFGGPSVTPEMASHGLKVVRQDAPGGSRVSVKLPPGEVICLKATDDGGGKAIDLTGEVKDGKLDWQSPEGSWKITGLCSPAAIQKVKRSAPGGEGHVLDPFSAKSIEAYLAGFDAAFKGFSAPMPRAQFHDSFEYYGAEWTPDFTARFQAARGYDLRDQLAAFTGNGDTETVARVKSDYRETLDELHLEYLKRWHDWSKSHGGITRNQAHGSPGNLLDHYAVSEIPETEIFRRVEDAQIPMMRFAASAADASGNRLVSSETFTWLDEHFQVTPEKLKEAADFIFLSGVNHLFFHGIPYSPKDAPWPGWLFYASTHMGENGGLWRDLPAFNGYIQRCQSILQEGKPSSDVLLYFPIHDIWHNTSEKLPLLTVHNQDEWLWPTPFYQASLELWKNGVTSDYASDRMLAGATVRDKKIVLGNQSYATIVLPGVKHMPVETLEKILGFRDQGVAVVIQGAWPSDVPGFHRHEERLAELVAMVKRSEGSPGIHQAQSGLIPTLDSLGIRRERMSESGLRFVRREHAEGFHYFIVNRGSETVDGYIPLAAPFESAVVLDPWKADGTGVAVRKDSSVRLRLEPGQSLVVRTFTHRKVAGPAWAHDEASPLVASIDGPWSIEFIEGGPVLPAAVSGMKTGSWTELADPAARNFSGTARYTTTFDFKGAVPKGGALDLGKVANTARVRLNGQDLGISWSSPHKVDLKGALKTGANLLEVEVTNLAANRIADLDRRKIPWKRFHEINFVNIDYKPFDASGWKPVESGLMGPVRLVLAKGE